MCSLCSARRLSWREGWGRRGAASALMKAPTVTVPALAECPRTRGPVSMPGLEESSSLGVSSRSQTSVRGGNRDSRLQYRGETPRSSGTAEAPRPSMGRPELLPCGPRQPTAHGSFQSQKNRSHL
ncbi:uncharacterized protein LOC116485173 [Hylobates moloch]|uniref:uncharacterized protein LOC116485173 n=1 Tax=Hylobates moloch TaxID=81572 RepID=UPI0013640A25|nr:uncharacterized protein LOC116485173 [Hylobates moloch]